MKHFVQNKTIYCLQKLSYDYPIMLMEEGDRRRCNIHHDCIDGANEEGCPIFTMPNIGTSLGITAVIIIISILIFITLRHCKLLDSDEVVGELGYSTETTSMVMVDSLVMTIQKFFTL